MLKSKKQTTFIAVAIILVTIFAGILTISISAPEAENLDIGSSYDVAPARD